MADRNEPRFWVGLLIGAVVGLTPTLFNAVSQIRPLASPRLSMEISDWRTYGYGRFQPTLKVANYGPGVGGGCSIRYKALAAGFVKTTFGAGPPVAPAVNTSKTGFRLGANSDPKSIDDAIIAITDYGDDFKDPRVGGSVYKIWIECSSHPGEPSGLSGPAVETFIFKLKKPAVGVYDPETEPYLSPVK